MRETARPIPQHLWAALPLAAILGRIPLHVSSLRVLASALALCALGSLFAGCINPPTGPPQTNSQAEMAVTSAAWRNDYPGSLAHSVRGQYYLNLGVSVTNRGSVPLAILAAEFSVFWQNETAGIPALAATISTTTIGHGQTGSATVAFLATALNKPVRVEFRQAGFTNTVSTNIPAPVPPPLEIMITAVSSNWSQNGTGNESASAGNTFLWVNATMMDHLTEPVALTSSSFKVADANGSSHRAQAVVGPGSLQSFAPAQVAVLFEVPVGFAPHQLLVDIVLGPWTQVDVPAPG